MLQPTLVRQELQGCSSAAQLIVFALRYKSNVTTEPNRKVHSTVEGSSEYPHPQSRVT